ncbi:hypothetical protein C8F01DRAFT_1257774 [Mycena amicta]|nr:hypothetical protein C8F01DRAFT_1257774 [Mycena amicta]
MPQATQASGDALKVGSTLLQDPHRQPQALTPHATHVILVTAGSRLRPCMRVSVLPLAALQVPRSRCHLQRPDVKCVVRQTTGPTTRPSVPSPPSRGPSSFNPCWSAWHTLVG